MNKEDFTGVLQSALLSYDNANVDEYFKDWQKPEVVKLGMELCNYLRNKEIK